jgi:hypothetical protein
MFATFRSGGFSSHRSGLAEGECSHGVSQGESALPLLAQVHWLFSVQGVSSNHAAALLWQPIIGSCN